MVKNIALECLFILPRQLHSWYSNGYGYISRNHNLCISRRVIQPNFTAMCLRLS